ncbi:HEAT repeat domain-containing protein [bacterium]|nr:HEAT repeat domain-containing protein [bacterium]
MSGLWSKLSGAVAGVRDIPALHDILLWFESLWQRFLQLGSGDQAFAIIIIAILVFTFLSLLFGLRALLIHLRRQQISRRTARLEEKWTQTLLDVLTGEREVKSIWRMVQSRDRHYFIDFLAAYARRVTGHERELIEDAARPWLRFVRRQIKSRDPAKRARALRTLADLTPHRTARLLLEALNDPSDLVSMVAARTLIRIGDSAHLPLILNRLKRYDIWSEQYTASMLASAGIGAAFFLRVYLNQASTGERERAIVLRALAMIGDSLALPIAETALRSSSSLSTQIVALDMIGELGTAEQAPLVRQHVRFAEESVLAHALLALGQIGDESDIPLLEAHLSHPSTWVALRAAIGLVKLGAEKTLHEFVASGSPNTVFAQQALAEEVYG